MTTPAMTAQEALATLRARGSYGWERDSPSIEIADALEAALSDAERRATEARALVLDAQTCGFDWMRAHDSLLAWIQDRPDVLHRLIAEPAGYSYPKPATPSELNALQSRLSAVEARCGLMRAEAYEECAKIAEAEATKGGQLTERIARKIAGLIRSILAYPGGKSEPTDHVVDANKVIVPLSRSGDSALVEARRLLMEARPVAGPNSSPWWDRRDRWLAGNPEEKP